MTDETELRRLMEFEKLVRDAWEQCKAGKLTGHAAFEAITAHWNKPTPEDVEWAKGILGKMSAPSDMGT